METISLTIDGIAVETTKGKNILEASLEADIYVPHLCHHPDLKPAGSCRLCVVEVEGMTDVKTACNTPAEDGMIINTKTPEIQGMRRTALDLIMSCHPEDCTGCPKYGKCELQSLTQYIGVNVEKYRRRSKGIATNDKNPLILHDVNRCILCGRCVRACHEMRGVQVLEYNKKGFETYVDTPDNLLLGEAGCKFCGACIEVCPTGTIRDKEHVIDSHLPYSEVVVPCRSGCPAKTDIPRYIRHIKEENYAMATAVIREKLPFPLILGNICNHRCEDACKRNDLNEAVSICRLKKFAIENDNKLWKQHRKQLPPTGKKVAIIGAGPAGMTAGYYLAKQGHSVTIFEALPEAGGMCQVGIPEYRLPREIVASEIKEIQEVGVEIHTNKRIESPTELFKQGYDALLVSIGAHHGIKLPIPGADLPEVRVNTEFLKEISLGKKEKIAGKVVVLGGGNVAFDCARSAKRLGAEEVHVVCLESREKMTASKDEIEEGQEEGVIIHNNRTFLEITSDSGKVTGVKCLKVESFEFDESKRLVFKTEENSEHIVEADLVIFAIGQRPDITVEAGLELAGGNTIGVDEKMQTKIEGIFSAGDAVTGTNSVVAAIESGRRAASSIDIYLGGDGDISEILTPEKTIDPWIGREEGFAFKERKQGRLAAVEERIKNFDAMDFGLDKKNAIEEATRCLQCDLRNCISSPKFWNEYKFK